MSGGVDSSVSAALLVKAGYEVVGIFIKVWEPEGVPCTWRAERRDAMRVAARLDIPLITLDLSKEYKQGVVDYMVAEYKAGRTPNPDVMCNKQVKFGAFYDWAMARGADYVATGHYAISKKVAFALDGHVGKSKTKSTFLLSKSKDNNKDQTYFLWTLKAEQLPHILFPIGGYNKSEVRQLADKFKLPNAEKKDSQGLCFIGKVDFKDFLKDFIKAKPGEVVDERGRVIGRHDGAVFYTIGERHGFNIKSQTPDSEPFYVVARDIKKNLITVATKDKLLKKVKREVELEKVNWLIEPNLVSSKKRYQSRIRHRGEFYPCLVESRKFVTVVKFLREPDAIAPGQSLVLYNKNICLGGGIIV